MIKSSTLIRLGIIIAVLLLVVVWQRKQQQAGLQQLSGEIKLNAPATQEQINRIEIVDPDGQGIQLIKQSNNWQVSPLASDSAQASESAQPADPDKVQKLLALLSQHSAQVISQNPERQTDLGVAPDKAVKLTYFQDQEVKYQLLVSSDDPKVFRPAEDQQTYRSQQLSFELIQTRPDSWLAPTPTPTPEAEASSSGQQNDSN